MKMEFENKLGTLEMMQRYWYTNYEEYFKN